MATDFYNVSRPGVYARHGRVLPLYYDRVEEDGKPYRGPRETWSEDQYDRRTHHVREFACRWFNLCDGRDLALYNQVQDHIANRWYTKRFEHRPEPVFALGAEKPPTAHWVYLEWVEHYVEGKPGSETIDDLAAPPRPLF